MAKSDKVKPDTAKTEKSVDKTIQGEPADSNPGEPESGDAAKEDSESEEEPVLEEAERETLEVLTGGSPLRGLKDLAKQKVDEELPGVSNAVTAAQGAIKQCSAGVETVVKVKDRLRSLVEQSPMQLAQKAVLGFAACAGIPLTYDLGNATPPGTSQIKSEHCTKVVDDVALGATAMRSVASCGARTDGEFASLAAQVAVQHVPGIRIDTKTLPWSGGPSRGYGLAIGKSEGIKRGDMFVAKVRDEVVAFGFVVDQGPGGENSVSTPSHFRFRTGDMPLGTTVEEHAKVGLILGARPQYSKVFIQKNLDSDALIGGAIEGGYNAGQFVGVGDEFWIRANVAYLVGKETETLIVIEALPEAQYYLFSRVAAFVQSGASITIASKSIPGGADVD